MPLGNRDAWRLSPDWVEPLLPSFMKHLSDPLTVNDSQPAGWGRTIPLEILTQGRLRNALAWLYLGLGASLGSQSFDS